MLFQIFCSCSNTDHTKIISFVSTFGDSIQFTNFWFLSENTFSFNSPENKLIYKFVDLVFYLIKITSIRKGVNFLIVKNNNKINNKLIDSFLHFLKIYSSDISSENLYPIEIYNKRVSKSRQNSIYNTIIRCFRWHKKDWNLINLWNQIIRKCFHEF